MKKAIHMIGNILFALVIIAILAFSANFALNKDPDKTIFGYRAYDVLSGSMEPELSVGDLVIVKAISPDEIQVGDIVTYYPTTSKEVTVTHRVLRTMLQDGQVIVETKGDASPQADPTFNSTAVIGVVIFHIPMLGGIISGIRSNPILALIFFVLVIILICLLGVLFKMQPPSENKTTPSTESVEAEKREDLQ